MIEILPTKILIVDDSAIERLKIKGYLGKRGYHIIEAANGVEGVECFIQHKPDLVLMDVNMPVMNGFDCIQSIRAYEKNMVTPILMLTGDDDMESIEWAFEVGANDFFPKPINFPLLHQRIRYALRDANRERDLRRITGLQETARALAGLSFWELDAKQQQFIWCDDAKAILHWVDELNPDPEKALAIVHPDDQSRLKAVFKDALDTGLKFDIEVRSPGSRQDYQLKIVGQRDGEQARLVGSFQDVTTQRRLEQQSNFLNYHDSVTGLPNRRLFQRDLEESIQLIVNNRSAVTVVVLEVLRFQQLVETYGTDVTDQLLVLLANQLKSFMPNDALVARLDGGVFALKLIVEVSIEHHEQILSELNQWIKHIDRAWMLDNRETFLTYTAGISVGQDKTTDASLLLRMAQRAQRLQKPSGGITIGFYEQDHEDSLHKRLKMESDLREALEQQQFYLVYQPQVDLSNDRVVGVEALIRWRHPQDGIVPPYVFIPVLEEMGLINALGEWILQEACQQQVGWMNEGVSLRMGINLSPAQFEQPDLPGKIIAIAKACGAQPELIELEITESLAMQNPDETIAILKRLRAFGFKIAIDDFGIGFSSLEYLLRFPLDTLKIDRAFIKDITAGRSDRAIVRALTSLCQGLGLTTIAEGVENQRQRDYVDALGATEIQGYLITPPLESKQLISFIKRRMTEHASINPRNTGE